MEITRIGNKATLWADHKKVATVNIHGDYYCYKTLVGTEWRKIKSDSLETVVMFIKEEIKLKLESIISDL